MSPASGLGAVTVTASGGGTITAVNGGTGVSATTTSGVVALANTGVTSLAVAGGMKVSASTGAVILSSTYTLPPINDGSQYVWIGSWTTTQYAEKLVLTIAAASGAEATSAQDQLTQLFLNTSATAPGFAIAANYDSTLGLGSGVIAPATFAVKSTSLSVPNVVVDIYALLGIYGGSSFYKVDISNAASWLDKSQALGTIVAPAGTTTIVPVAEASVWSQFPATQVVTFPNGGPNINTFNAGGGGVGTSTNYCDFNAAPAGPGIASVLRIVGQGGSQIYLQPATIGFVTGTGGTFDFSKPPRYNLGSFVDQPVIQRGANIALTAGAGTAIPFPVAYSAGTTPVVSLTVKSSSPVFSEVATVNNISNTGFIAYCAVTGGIGSLTVDWVSFGE